MKYFTLILFLFSAIILNAQINMEEVSYIPSPSGYYNNLIVKGNSNIKNLYTFSFNVQSYASFLNLSLKDTNKMFIQDITISTGTAALFSEFPSSDVNDWELNPEEISRNEADIPTILMNGGNLSMDKSKNEDNSKLIIDYIKFPPYYQNKSPEFDVRTENTEYMWNSAWGNPNQYGLITDKIYILGMEVPKCQPVEYKGRSYSTRYYWQPLKAVNGQVFTVLACGPTICKNPERQESCLSRNQNNVQRYEWRLPRPPFTESSDCYCIDTQNEQTVDVNPNVFYY